MTPPTPSISSMSCRRSIALSQKPMTPSTSMLRPSRRAARSGDSGARNRHGAMRSIASIVTGAPSARSSTAGSLLPACAGSNPLTTGLMASTLRPMWRKCPISEAAI
jgi:hypothetical protein